MWKAEKSRLKYVQQKSVNQKSGRARESKIRENIWWADQKTFFQNVFLNFFKADAAVRIRNFGKDIKDSIAYIHLIKQIAPEDAFVDKSALQNDGMSMPFCPDFILILSKFYQILSRFFKNSLYPNFIQILS